MTMIEIVQVVLAATMPVVVVGVIIERLVSGRGMGARMIQFLAVGLLIPATAILSLQKMIDGGATAAIIGSMIGYLLSGIGNYEPGRPKEKKCVPPANESSAEAGGESKHGR